MFYHHHPDSQQHGSFKEENPHGTATHLLASSYEPASQPHGTQIPNVSAALDEWQAASSMPSALGNFNLQSWDNDLPASWYCTEDSQPDYVTCQQPGISETPQSETLPYHQPSQPSVDFSASHSPHSMTSTESSLISPPPQFQPDPTTQSQDTTFLLPTTAPRRRRSSSIPPDFFGTQRLPFPSVYGAPTAPNETKVIQIERAPAPPSKPVDSEEYHRRLVQRLERVDFEDITVAELKDLLRELGLSCAGRKADLMGRLRATRDDMLLHKKPSLLHRPHPSPGSPYTRSRVVKRPLPPSQQPQWPSPQFAPGLSSFPPQTPPMSMTAAMDIRPSAMSSLAIPAMARSDTTRVFDPLSQPSLYSSSSDGRLENTNNMTWYDDFLNAFMNPQ